MNRIIFNSFWLFIFLLSKESLLSNRYIDSLIQYVDTAQVDDAYLEALLRLSYTLAYQNPQEAVSYINRANSVSNTLGSSNNTNATIQQYYGIIYTQLSDYHRAIEHVDRSILLYNKAKEFNKAAVSRLQKAIIYNQTRELEKAHKVLQEAERIFRENDGRRYLGHVNLELGNTMGKAGDSEKALEYYLIAKQECQQNPSTNCLEVALNNIASTYKELNQPHEALEIFEELISQYEQNDPYRKLGIAYQNMAYIYYGNLNNPKSSIIYAEKALSESRKLNNTEAIAEAQLSLGESYLAIQNYSMAEKYLSDGLSKATEVKHYQWISEIHQHLAELYKNQGNYPKAFESMSLHKDLRDSIKNIEIRNSINEIEAKYQTEKKEQEIALLESEKALSNLQLSSQKRITLLSSLAGLILAILSIILYNLFKKNRAQKDELSIIVQEKDYLLREIHHRVKNNLQVISSLLYLQSEKLNDPAAQDALNIGRGRVKSMALIHKNLYGVNQSGEVDLKSYLEDLCSELFDSYNLRGDDILLNTSFNQIKIDVDTLIPLGLILNELISNALKYAFEGKENGMLRISSIKEDDKLIVVVKDDGIGWKEVTENSKSFGTELIQSFVSQLSAEMTRDSDKGTDIRITIPIKAEI